MKELFKQLNETVASAEAAWHSGSFGLARQKLEVAALLAKALKAQVPR